MPPFTYRFNDDTNSSLAIPQSSQLFSNPRWTYGPQPVPNTTESQLQGLMKFGIGIGALGLLGQHKFSSGKLGWDYLLSGIRGAEEYSPGNILRTFQLSNLLSPLESASLQTRYFGLEEIMRLRKTEEGRLWLEYHSRLTGRNLGLLEEGFRFEAGQLRVGRTGGDVLLKHAGTLRSPTRTGTRFQEGYIRSLTGGPFARKLDRVTTSPIEYIDAAGKLQKEAFMFHGGQTRLQSAGRFLSGYGTSLVERLNQLARAPFELPVISDILKRVPYLNRHHFDVIPSSGLKTFGKLALKLGILAPALYLTYQELDYETRKAKFLDNTILAEGVTAGIATAWARSQVAVSKVANSLGLHDYRKRQEEIAPGSTKLSTLAAFPIMGALGGVGIGYMQRLRRQINYQREGLDLATTSRALRAETSVVKNLLYEKEIPKELIDEFDSKTFGLIKESAEKRLNTWSGRLAKTIAMSQKQGSSIGKIARFLGEMTPGKVKWMTGAAIGTALIAPFIPGALIPSKTPEELEDLYSGKTRVPIRKGRRWEMGLCNTAESLIKTGLSTSKPAKDISLDDMVVGSDGQKHKILGIYKRFHKGKVVKIKTYLDRNLETGLTENHIVPVMKEKNSYGYHILKDQRIVEEIEAGEIEVGDFVQVPIPELNIKDVCKNILSLEDYIKTGHFIIVKDKILPAQINWYSKKIQQSGGANIPRQVEFTHRLGRLFGYFLAEGSLSFKKNIPHMIETVHAATEKWIVDDIIYIVKSLFDITPTVRFKDTGPLSKEGCWIVRICNSLLARVFFELFYQSDRSKDKEIPWWFLDTSYWFINAVILGLWRGDGHKEEKRYVISSARQQFVQFVQVALLSQGIVANIRTKETGKYIKKNGENSIRYKISWHPNSQGQSGQGYQWKNKQLYVRVVEVNRESYNGEVYDFEIDHPDHLLQAGTFLVHNSPYEGSRIDRFEEHWYPKMLRRGKEKSIWGEDAPSPITRAWKENMTYELEKKHYYDRPYPISSPAFSEVPLIGPLLSATVGRIFKPPALMHEEEWKGVTLRWEKGGQVSEGPDDTIVLQQTTKRMPPKYGEKVIPGELEPGAPISPYGIKGVIGKQANIASEMVGLPGFTLSSIKERITGEPDFFAQEMQLESAGRIYSSERDFWDRELGGMLGTSELLRRLYPHKMRQIELYNPIRNQMPEWLPGPGEKAPNFLIGDPFCVSSDTMIETSSGLKCASNIQSGTIIKTHKGNWAPIKKVIERYILEDEKVFKIKVNSLSALPLVVSEEHPLFTENSWVQAKEIKVGDYVGYPIPHIDENLSTDSLLDLTQYTDLPYTKDHIYIQGTQEYADCVWYLENIQKYFKRGELKKLLDKKQWQRKSIENAQKGIRYNTLNRIPRYINPHSKEWGIISGYWLSEGSSCEGSLSFAFNQSEDDFIHELDQAFITLFNRSGSKYNSSQIYQGRLSNGCNYIITCKALAQIIPSIWGKGFDKKHLFPQWIGSIKETLRCLYNGDGSFYLDKNKPRLSLKLENPQLLWEVRQELLKHGFVASWIENQLIIRGQAAKDCALFLGCKYFNVKDSSRLARHTYIKNGYVWMKVFSKEEINIEKVYGFEVDQDNSFCAGGVATHNTKVPSGETRLPGPGLETRFPELKGVDPSNYSAIHRFAILSDVAPYSEKLKVAHGQVREAIRKKELSADDMILYKQTVNELKQKKIRREFTPYKYKERARTPMEEILAQAEPKEQPGAFERTLGRYWETLTHNAETPLEYLTPVSPAHKLVHARTAVEDYEANQVYGKEISFWQHPIRDFIKPFAESTKHTFGLKGIPDDVQERRDIEEYFDILKYMKYTRLKNVAQASQDQQATEEFENKRRETLFGINPYTFNFSHTYRALPRRERDYFSEFTKADMEERAKIMEMIPENEKALMMAKWQQKDKEDMEKAIKKGLLSQEQINRAKDLEEQLYNEMRTEGMPKDKELWAEYLATREQGESYPDWYRRVKLLPEKLKGRPLPGPDWVGFCIPLDEEVIDNNGFRLQAKDVTIKHQLNTHLEAGMVKQTFKREINEKINKISLSRNKVESVRLTKKHPILCIQADKCNFNLKHNSICTNKITNWRCDYCTNKKFEDYKIEWINAEDINTNTYILYPLLQCSKENLKLDLINEVDWESINCTVGDNTIYPKSGIRKSMNRFIEIDESIGWLIGYYLADGNVWVTKDRLRGVQFTTSTKTISILELAQKIIEKHFGLRGRIIVRHRKSGNSAYLVVASSMFAKLIDTWVGRYCDKKFAPYWLEKVTCNTQNAILDGLNTGDATKDKRQRLVITNYELTRMAKRIWESNGIGCSFRKKNSRNYKDTYMIEPLWQSSDVFFIKGFVAYRVEENKEIDYQGEVYDFEIENHHSFLTKIAILHNSPQVDLEDVKLKILSQEGKNLFEYDLWPDRVRAVARRPIITKAAEELREPPEKDEKQIREKINAVLAANNIRASHVSLTKVSGLQENELDLRIEEDRAASSKEKIRRLGYG